MEKGRRKRRKRGKGDKERKGKEGKNTPLKSIFGHGLGRKGREKITGKVREGKEK